MSSMEKATHLDSPYHAVRVSEHVYWVGAIDWSLRDFHGYATQRGTTYNAFLVLGEKITLIDTVKAPFKDELLARIASVIDPARIDYIISNHAEMDHSGCLPALIAELKPEKVYASPNGVKALTEHFHLTPDTVTAISDGETLALGELHFTFLETRMLHWPDSMFTYLVEDGVLFSNDAFGMHLATTERFDDEIDPSILEYEAKTYFANILLPYASLITKLLAKVGGLGLTLNAIATDHGPVWRSDIHGALARYGVWAAQQRSTKAVIVYDTMWESTAKMARAISEGLLEGGATVKFLPLNSSHRSDVATEMLDAGALLVGSPTMNNNLFPTVADVLTYLKGLRPQGLVGAAFGSYGWGGEAVKQIEEILSAMHVELVGDLKVKYVPDAAALAQCHALGLAVAERLTARPVPTAS
ncbi:MAG TPA: FprA family A-type flavoprotein [Armatimonadota bacterium]|jgi:flavorubredoxin